MEKNVVQLKDVSKEQEHSLTSGEEELPHPRINFDYQDEVRRQHAINALPVEWQAQVVEASVATANALYREGGNGPAAARLLAKEVSLRRIALSQADATVASLRDRMKRDPSFNPQRLAVAVKSQEAEHRQFLAAMNTLARLTGVRSPTLHLNGPNYVHVDGGGRGDEAH